MIGLHLAATVRKREACSHHAAAVLEHSCCPRLGLQLLLIAVPPVCLPSVVREGLRRSQQQTKYSSMPLLSSGIRGRS